METELLWHGPLYDLIRLAMIIGIVFCVGRPAVRMYEDYYSGKDWKETFLDNRAYLVVAALLIVLMMVLPMRFTAPTVTNKLDEVPSSTNSTTEIMDRYKLEQERAEKQLEAERQRLDRLEQFMEDEDKRSKDSFNNILETQR